MTKEKAQQIVDLISDIAKGAAWLALSKYCNDIQRFEKNTEYLTSVEQQLVNLLTEEK